MKITVWFNRGTKLYEAMPVTAGRPINPNAKERKTRRVIVSASTKQAAINALGRKLGTKKLVVV